MSSLWARVQERVAAFLSVSSLLRLVWSCSPRLAVVALGLRLLGAAAPAGSLWIAKLIIDQTIVVLNQQASSERIWWLLGVELVLTAIAEVVGRLYAVVDALLAERFEAHSSILIMERSTQMDLATLEDPNFRDTLERARGNPQAKLQVLSSAGRLCQGLMTLVTLGAGIVWVSSGLLGAMVIAVIPGFLSESHFAGLRYTTYRRLTPQRREMEYLSHLATDIQSVKELKLFGLGKYLSSRYLRVADEVYRSTKEIAVRSGKMGALFAVLSTSGFYAAYVLMLMHTLQGRMTVGDLTFLLAAFIRIRGTLMMVLSDIQQLAERSLLLRDFVYFLESPVQVEHVGGLPGPRTIRSGLEFRNVSFRYPGCEQMVLEDVSFRLAPDETLSLVGANGAGKTTIVKLIARLYDPVTGSVLVDGVDLRDYQLDEWRNAVAVVLQDYVRYDLLLSENVGFGYLPDLDNVARIRKAVVRSGADRIVGRLPDGIHQMLGRRFDGGVDLSTGEWQKIAIARAYMRPASLFVLDEPAAALDCFAEHELFRCFAELAKGRMGVLISHRLSNVRMADRILVFEQGRLSESGTHEELLARRGSYARMFQLQARSYR